MAKARRLDKKRFMETSPSHSANGLVKKVDSLLSAFVSHFPVHPDGQTEAAKMANEPSGKGSKLVFYPRGALSARNSIIRQIQALGEKIHSLGNATIEVRPLPGATTAPAAKGRGRSRKAK